MLYEAEVPNLTILLSLALGLTPYASLATLWANYEPFCFQLSFRSPSMTGLEQNFLCCLWEQKGSQSTDG